MARAARVPAVVPVLSNAREYYFIFFISLLRRFVVPALLARRIAFCEGPGPTARLLKPVPAAYVYFVRTIYFSKYVKMYLRHRADILAA